MERGKRNKKETQHWPWISDTMSGAKNSLLPQSKGWVIFYSETLFSFPWYISSTWPCPTTQKPTPLWNQYWTCEGATSEKGLLSCSNAPSRAVSAPHFRGGDRGCLLCPCHPTFLQTHKRPKEPKFNNLAFPSLYSWKLRFCCIGVVLKRQPLSPFLLLWVQKETQVLPQPRTLPWAKEMIVVCKIHLIREFKIKIIGQRNRVSEVLSLMSLLTGGLGGGGGEGHSKVKPASLTTNRC